MNHGTSNGRDSESLLDRRSCLKLAGGLVGAGALGTAATGRIAGAESGDGSAGYGVGEYGGGGFGVGDGGGEDEQPSGAAPTVDGLDASESGAQNPHADVSLEWAVSDADGDLNSMKLDVSDGSNSVYSEWATLSGEAASGSSQFQIVDGASESYDVTLLVVDAAGNETTERDTVTA